MVIKLKEETDIIEKITILLDKIRPYLISDGGNLEFVKYEDNILYVKLTGACADCSMMDITLKDGIEQLIISEIPEISEVRNTNSNL